MKQLTNGTCLAIYDETLDCFLDKNGYQYSYPNDNIIYSDGKKIDSIQLRDAISDLRKCNYSDHNIYVVRVKFKCEFSKANRHIVFDENEYNEKFIPRFIEENFSVGKQCSIEEYYKHLKSNDKTGFNRDTLNYFKHYLQENFYNKTK